MLCYYCLLVLKYQCKNELYVAFANANRSLANKKILFSAFLLPLTQCLPLLKVGRKTSISDKKC